LSELELIKLALYLQLLGILWNILLFLILGGLIYKFRKKIKEVIKDIIKEALKEINP